MPFHSIADLEGADGAAFSLSMARDVWDLASSVAAGAYDTEVKSGALATVFNTAVALLKHCKNPHADASQTEQGLHLIGQIPLYGPPIATHAALVASRIIGDRATPYMKTTDALLRYVVEMRSVFRLPAIPAESITSSMACSRAFSRPQLTLLDVLVANYDLDRIHMMYTACFSPRAVLVEHDVCMNIASAPCVATGITYDAVSSSFTHHDDSPPSAHALVDAIDHCLAQTASAVQMQVAVDLLMLTLLANRNHPLGISHVRAAIRAGAALRGLGILFLIKHFRAAEINEVRESATLRDLEHAGRELFKPSNFMRTFIAPPSHDAVRNQAIAREKLSTGEVLHNLMQRTQWPVKTLARIRLIVRRSIEAQTDWLHAATTELPSAD